MASSVEVQELLIDTLNLLEWRLRRLEFVHNGTVNNAQAPKQEQAPSSASTVIARVKKLEHSLQQIALKSEVVSELIKLRMAPRTPSMTPANRRSRVEASRNLRERVPIRSKV
jgi:hypothetical protein